jgi:hypothetical protein
LFGRPVLTSFLYLPWKWWTENKKITGYHFGRERSVGPRRRGICALCERCRIVSSTSSRLCRIPLMLASLPPRVM